MATRKMTFTLPEELAAQFVRRVSVRNRSRYLAEALSQKLSERDRRLIRSAQAANKDREVLAIEKEFDALPEAPSGSWDAAPGRRMVGSSRSRPRRRN